MNMNVRCAWLLLAVACASGSPDKPFRVQLLTANGHIRVVADGSVTIVGGVGWLHGSTFTVACGAQPSCTHWRLRSLKTGKLLSVAVGGEATALADDDTDVAEFLVAKPEDGRTVQLSTAGGWLAVVEGRLTVADAMETATSFELIEVPFIRGANLGSLFIPEKWMVPSFYRGSDATSLCGLVRADPALAARRMSAHLSSFVNARDFAWLADRDFNAVRLPVGWWNALGGFALEAGARFVPRHAEESLAAIDRVFEWSRLHGLRVLLDLHGAVGSQNGADHSGCDDGGIGFGDDGASIEMSLAALSVLAARYGRHPSLFGFTMLNEPAWKVEWDHGRLLGFYERAYTLIRTASSTALVVFNVLYR